MSQASLPSASKNPMAARHRKLSRLVLAAAITLAASPAPGAAPRPLQTQKGQSLQAEQPKAEQPKVEPKPVEPLQQPGQTPDTGTVKQPPKYTVKITPRRAYVMPCPGKPDSGKVTLRATINPKPPKPSKPTEYTWKGDKLSGTGNSITWDLSGLTPNTYTATVETPNPVPGLIVRLLSASVNVIVRPCSVPPPPKPPCPAPVVTCPEEVKAGERLICKATFTTTRDAPSYQEGSWSIFTDNGKKLFYTRLPDGQSVAVDTTGLGGRSVVATFGLRGYEGICIGRGSASVVQPADNNNQPDGGGNSNQPDGTENDNQSGGGGNSNQPGETDTPVPPATPVVAGTLAPFSSPSTSSTASTTPPGATSDSVYSPGVWGVSLDWRYLLLIAALLVLTFFAFRWAMRDSSKPLDVRPAPKPLGSPDEPDESSDGRDKAFVAGGTKRVKDELQCTVFAPFEAAPGDGFLVQAFAHLAEHARLLEGMAKEADRDAVRRGADKLGEVVRGQELFFHLDMPGLAVDEPVQSVVWNGDIESVQFAVGVPDQFKPRRLNCKLTVSVEGIPIGHVKFVFEVAAAPPPAGAETPLNSSGQFVRYRKGFVSYASEDLAEVLARVQVMTQLGIECFQDVLSLRPGERWEKKLYLHIDESDVFFLFWSAAAHKSVWVEKEVRYALRRKSEDEDSPPEIMPVILQGPPEVPPPSYLPDYHFNDPFALLIKAARTRRAEKEEG
ncbi:MAG TPA: toll/interleukin-1 receptor domain-containing protein [Pyrinomonadaceae bacterium]